MILFCIPGASASAMMFIKWRKMFDGNVEVCPVELPGRGLRFRDAFISDMKLLAKDLLQADREKTSNALCDFRLLPWLGCRV